MSDAHLRALERRWRASGDAEDAEALDAAARRVGLVSEPRRAAARALHTVLASHFDPRHLRTPCCGKRVYWSNAIPTAGFETLRALYCLRCTRAARHSPRSVPRRRRIAVLIVGSYIAGRLHEMNAPPLRLWWTDPATPHRLSSGYSDVLDDDTLDSGVIPSWIGPVNAAGYLDDRYLQPIPTKILSTLLRHAYETMGEGTIRLTLGSLYFVPIKGVIEAAPHLHACPVCNGNGGAVVDCSECDGTGRRRLCIACNGRGVLRRPVGYEIPAHCEDCFGTGFAPPRWPSPLSADEENES